MEPVYYTVTSIDGTTPISCSRLQKEMCLPIKWGLLWKFRPNEVDDWIRSGGAAEDTFDKSSVASEE